AGLGDIAADRPLRQAAGSTARRLMALKTCAVVRTETRQGVTRAPVARSMVWTMALRTTVSTWPSRSASKISWSTRRADCATTVEYSARLRVAVSAVDSMTSRALVYL